MPSLLRFALGLFAVLTANANPPSVPAGPEAAWVDLFNGRDLSGWLPVNVAPDTFTVRDGMIVCSGSPTGFLVSDRAYENFVLELEWRHLKAAGNNGILIWASDLPATGAPFPRAVEVQVLDPGAEVGRANAGRMFTGHGDIMAIRGAGLTLKGSNLGKRPTQPAVRIARQAIAGVEPLPHRMPGWPNPPGGERSVCE